MDCLWVLHEFLYIICVNYKDKIQNNLNIKPFTIRTNQNRLEFYSTDVFLAFFSKKSLKLSPQSQMEVTTGSRRRPISLS